MTGNVSSETLRMLQLFSASVRSILRLRGLRQSHLAKGIGADSSKVSRWLSCKAIPNAVWVVKIADYLDVSLDKLFQRESAGSDQLPEIHRHAQQILTLAGADHSHPGAKKKRKKAGK